MENLPPGCRQFLVRAKRAVNAAWEPERKPYGPAPRDVHYEEEDGWRYTGSYLDSGRMTGQETVWKDGRPVWVMNHCGRVTGEGFSPGFLKEALLLLAPDAPYRGPIEYQEGPLLYCNMFAGGLDWFYGREEIFASGVSAFECIYHGGAIP